MFYVIKMAVFTIFWELVLLFLKLNKTFRTVDIFISQLNSHIDDAELRSCVEEVKKDLEVHDIHCTNLKPRYKHLYASFAVSIKINSCDMRRVIDMFMSAESWPSGIFVCGYFKPKHGKPQEWLYEAGNFQLPIC